MWPFKRKKLGHRRLEVRKNIPQVAPSIWARLSLPGGLPTVVMAVLFFAGAGAMDLWPVNPFNYRLGQYISQNIYARTAFMVLIEPDRAHEAPSRPATQASTDQNESTTKPATQPVESLINSFPRSRVYKRGQLLVNAGNISGSNSLGTRALTQSQLALLRAEHDEYFSNERLTNPFRYYGRQGARAAILLLITAMLFIYTGRYFSKILSDRWGCFALLIVMLLMLAINKGMAVTLGWNRHLIILPVVIAAMIITITHEQRYALAAGPLLAGIMVLQLRAGMGMLIVATTAVAVTVIQLREIRTRTRLTEIAAVTAIVTGLTVLAKDLAEGVPLRFSGVDILWSAGAALVAGFLVQGALPLIERLFRVATSMTLLEWCDDSKPLRKRLSLEASGTYNHSLQLGAMCESAADSINANGLLARVGAYYHDIGKINKPEYFAENEISGMSKHEKLSPAMSLLIILGHVKDGVELAHEYNLPAVLHEFVAAHHGTTLVQFFYHAATQQRKSDTDRAPDEVEFRYPGPKPHLKEAAILMLADASESSVRAMDAPTPGNIENQVHSVVNQRLMDGQLDECELTLAEVHKIETSMVKSLCSIYHSRIAYPKAPDPKAKNGNQNGDREKAGETEVSTGQDQDPSPTAAQD